jgi:plasmid stabilization system protein ParE
MRFTVSILRRAQSDVDEIYEWIARRSPAGAVRWYAAFCQAASELCENADRCAQAAESGDLGIDIRQRLFKTRRGRVYRLLFTIIGSHVRILRVRGPGQPPIERADAKG